MSKKIVIDYYPSASFLKVSVIYFFFFKRKVFSHYSASKTYLNTVENWYKDLGYTVKVISHKYFCES